MNPRKRVVVRLAAALALVAAVAGAGDAGGQTYAPESPDRYFRFEWQKAGPKITGYVYNTSNRRAARMQLLVQGIDRSGKIVARTTTWVAGGVPPNNRAFFEVSVADAASYRLSVLSFEWVDERRDLRSF